MVTKEDNEDFEDSTKCWICDNDYIDIDINVRDLCYIIGKYRGSPHRDVNFTLNYKNTIVFCNLKDFNSDLVMQELDLIGKNK